MTTVTISGWREGLNKVQLNHLLRQRTGCGLGEAKHAVDQLLAGEALAYEFSDSESASDFRRSVEAVGARLLLRRGRVGEIPDFFNE